jgi:hypothetical protein
MCRLKMGMSGSGCGGEPLRPLCRQSVHGLNFHNVGMVIALGTMKTFVNLFETMQTNSMPWTKVWMLAVSVRALTKAVTRMGDAFAWMR